MLDKEQIVISRGHFYKMFIERKRRVVRHFERMEKLRKKMEKERKREEMRRRQPKYIKMTRTQFYDKGHKIEFTEYIHLN